MQKSTINQHQYLLGFGDSILSPPSNNPVIDEETEKNGLKVESLINNIGQKEIDFDLTHIFGGMKKYSESGDTALYKITKTEKPIYVVDNSTVKLFGLGIIGSTKKVDYLIIEIANKKFKLNIADYIVFNDIKTSFDGVEKNEIIVKVLKGLKIHSIQEMYSYDNFGRVFENPNYFRRILSEHVGNNISLSMFEISKFFIKSYIHQI